MSRPFGLIGLWLAAGCGGGGDSRLVGSTAPCRFQDWMRAPKLAVNPTIQAALDGAPFTSVPGKWLTLADGSGYFVAISFDGTRARNGVLVVFTCDGRNALTERFGRSTWIRLFPGSLTSGRAPSYLVVQEARGDSGRIRSLETYYRFRRGRVTPVGQLIQRQVVRQDSANATEESATLSWRVGKPNVIQRCVESQQLHLDSTTGAWRPDASSRRYFAEIYRLDGDELRLDSRVNRCLAQF